MTTKTASLQMRYKNTIYLQIIKKKNKQL